MASFCLHELIVDGVQKIQTLGCDRHIGRPLVVLRLGFCNEILLKKPVEQAGNIGVAIDHPTLDLDSRDGVRALTSEYPQDVELLGGDAERFEKILLPPHQPVRREEDIYGRLLVNVAETGLFYFVFDFHKKKEGRISDLSLLQPWQFMKNYLMGPFTSRG